MPGSTVELVLLSSPEIFEIVAAAPRLAAGIKHRQAVASRVRRCIVNISSSNRSRVDADRPGSIHREDDLGCNVLRASVTMRACRKKRVSQAQNHLQEIHRS